jgi:hypothetical protein
MPQDDIEKGCLICVVGVALVRSAEFMIFRIGQDRGGDVGAARASGVLGVNGADSARSKRALPQLTFQTSVGPLRLSR